MNRDRALDRLAHEKFLRGRTRILGPRAGVLRDLDLALWPGEVVALEDEWFRDPSTLLRCAAGLLRSDAGSILWFRSTRCVPRERLAYIGHLCPRLPLATSSCASSGGESRGAATRSTLPSSERSAHRVRLLLVDDLPFVGAIERRLVLHSCSPSPSLWHRRPLHCGEELASAPFVSRVVTLVDGALPQRKEALRHRSDRRFVARHLSIRVNAQYSNRD